MPFTNLTKQDQPNQLEWGEAQDRAFENLKSHIVNHPIVRLPEFEKQFIFQTDACNSGIGAIHLQEELGVKHPVAFASRKLLTRERVTIQLLKRSVWPLCWPYRSFRTFSMEMILFWKRIIHPCCILGKPNMERMVVSCVGLWFSNSTNLLSELLKDQRM